MSVARAQQEIDSREFSEWMAYFELQPFGDECTEMNFGMVCSVIVNAFSAKGAKAAKPTDFMLSKLMNKEPQTAEQMEAMLDQFTEQHPQLMAKADDGGNIDTSSSVDGANGEVRPGIPPVVAAGN